MNKEWTEEELEILRQDRAAKTPVPVTAAKLGRPVHATYLRARLIGTRIQTHRPWDEAEVARLRALLAAETPLTDKQIAAELGRTVSQIRWKMRDLNLIGVRDLTKLAKATSSKTTPVTPPPVRQDAPLKPAKPALHRTPEVTAKTLHQSELYTPLELALKLLKGQLATRLKETIAESEMGMVRAAKDAISEKSRIDQRLAKLSQRVTRVEAPAARKTDKVTPPPRQDKPRAPVLKPVTRAAPPAIRKAAGQVPSPALAPPVARPTHPDPATVPMSGRDGWKSVFQDPARVAAQARARATKRADAVDLAQAAQSAIERFIAERGVTRIETDASPAEAAKAAIAEKGRIDERLTKLGECVVKAAALTVPKRVAPPISEKRPSAPARRPVTKALPPAISKATARVASPPPAPPPPAPKIVVLEEPIVARPTLPDPAAAPTSGRGGWKSVRRDPARVAAQARAKATNRADAVDLAQAAQSAIERFIAERGVTRSETDASQTLVSRLQARGYIVVRDDSGWVIDQRHRVASDTDLAAFAEARGISPDSAATERRP